MAFFSTLEAHTDAVCLYDDRGATLSYTQLAQSADDWFAAHDQAGKRCLALMALGQDLPSVTAIIGALRAGVVPMLVDASIKSDALSRLIEHYRPRYVFGRLDRVLPLASGSVRCRGAQGEHQSEHQSEHRGQNHSHNQRKGHYALIDTGEPSHTIHSDLCAMLPTSGSTGDPKFVRLSEQNLNANAWSIAEYLELTSEERAILTLPISYSYGLSVLTSHLAAGASLVVQDHSVVAREFWDLVVASGATSMAGVPYTYETLKRLKFERLDTGCLRTFTQAGGRLDPDITAYFHAACANKSAEFITMYGQTEATARIAYMPPDMAQDKAGAVGIPIPGGSVSLEPCDGAAAEDISPAQSPDNQASDAAPTDHHELIYRGPNVCMGYARGPDDLARGDDNHGVLRTGDLAMIDQDGVITITGRLKRMAKIFGTSVNLDHVETILREAGLEGYAIAHNDTLTLAHAGGVDGLALKQAVLARCAIHPSRVKARMVNTIPRRANDKVDYEALKSAVSQRIVIGNSPFAGVAR